MSTTMRTVLPLAGASAARIFASSVGPRILCEAPDMAGLARMVETGQTETKAALTAAASKLGTVETKAKEVDERLAQIEQKLARPGGRGGATETKSLGQMVVEHEQVKSLMTGARRGVVNLSFPASETKTILSAPGTWGAGVSPSNSLVVADRQPLVPLAQRPLRIRDVLPPGQTTSNAIEYPVQTGFTNNAAVVAENTLKPLSDVTFDLRSANVRTIAHRMVASRQILDDAPMLQSFIDSQMRYGLGLAEEAELLNGDGSGQHLLGLVPSATPFSAPFAAGPGEQIFDRVLAAIAQLEASYFQASAVVLNPLDWRRAEAVKDGMGRYLVGDPQGRTAPLLWGLPVVTSASIPVGQFLTGDFQIACQLFDRMSVEVLISTEDMDNFSKNMITIRCEERIVLAVYRPQALIYGTLP